MLTIEDLHVNIGDKKVLEGVNLKINEGETFILFGPNGSGKTSLLMALMGFTGYKVTKGKILFKGKDITDAPMYERARLGIGMSFQRPPTIHGLRTRHLVKMCARNGVVNPDLLAEMVNMTDFLDRDINSGFSGGEIKRSELLQLMAQQPEYMQLVGKIARNVLDGNFDLNPDLSLKERKERTKTAGLIITHTGYILDYVNADRGQVLYKGHLCCEGRPRDILDHIREHGYQECVRCMN